MDLRPKKLDVYIVKKFLLTFGIALILIIGIVIIFDISEKIDDFVSKQAPMKAIIFDYYVNFIPYFTNMFSPLFVFITVIFFTSRLAANSEIIAILSCGVSFHRLMVPYFFSAFVIFLLSLTLNLFIIPRANVTRAAFEIKYTSLDYKSLNSRNMHYQINPGQFVYVESFSTWNNTAYGFTLEEIRDNQLVSKVSAEAAVWDNKKTVESLSYSQLNELIDTQNMRGDKNVMYAQIEKHTRFALPFSAFILTIMGVALSSRKKRGGIGWNIGVGIALSFSYILFLRFSQMFVFTGTLPPWLALWLPNIIFAIITGFLYKYAPK